MLSWRIGGDDTELSKCRCYGGGEPELICGARHRMDAMDLHANEDPFAGTELSNDSDNILPDIWVWCAIKGCRSVCMAGRLYMRNGKWGKFK